MKTHLDLFSGIGGFSLAAHWAGFTTVAHCEIEPYPRAVLLKHWPHVPVFEDVRNVTVESLRAAGIERVDLVTGGFPCQDISIAGQQAGLSGERSGLWFEMLRVIRELRPLWVVVENVPNLYSHGIDTVLAGLEEAGYEATPCVVGAWAVGAPHRRDRVFIVGRLASAKRPTGEWWGQCESCRAESEQGEASQRRGHTNESARSGVTASAAEGVGNALGCGRSGESRRGAGAEPADGHGGDQVIVGLADDDLSGCNEERQKQAQVSEGQTLGGSGSPDARGVGQADASCRERVRSGPARDGRNGLADSGGMADADDPGCEQLRSGEPGGEFLAPFERAGGRQSEPGLGRGTDEFPTRLDCERFVSGPEEAQKDWEPPRLAKGVKNRVARLKACGNAVDPLQVYPILKVIADWFSEQDL